MENIPIRGEKIRQNKVLGIKEAAEQLGVSVNTLYSWISQRKIEYVKMGRLVKFRQSAIDRFIQDHTVPFVQ